MLKFSLLHASARPQAWRASHDAWLSNAVKPVTVEYILCCHSSDVSAFLHDVLATESECPIGDFRLVNNVGTNSAVANWNKAAKISTGDVLLLIADDAFPCKRWDLELAGVLPDLGEHVIRTSTGGMADNYGLIIHPIMTRAYYERYGYVLYPEYQHVHCDTDFTRQAERDGVIIEARHLLFPHRHFSHGDCPEDDVYRRANGPESQRVGAEVLAKRWSSKGVAA